MTICLTNPDSFIHMEITGTIRLDIIGLIGECDTIVGVT